MINIELYKPTLCLRAPVLKQTKTKKTKLVLVRPRIDALVPCLGWKAYIFGNDCALLMKYSNPLETPASDLLTQR